MWKDEDGSPRLGRTALDLGVRYPGDVEVGENGDVGPNGGGMSVSPSWRLLPSHRIPRRLRDQVGKARGPDEAACFRFGDGPFEVGGFADGLVLTPDSPRHAVVEPASPMPLANFEAALAATRADWIIDES
jgi:hypothetical protein